MAGRVSIHAESNGALSEVTVSTRRVEGPLSNLKRWTANKKEALVAGTLKALKRFSRCRNP